jgi:hypothetical protein
MDTIFMWDGVAGCSALRSEVVGCSASKPSKASKAAAGRSALPELLEAAEDMKRCIAT